MSSHRIHIFISHSWAYPGHYETLREWVFTQKSRGQASLTFLDYSVPKDDPVHNAPTQRLLKEAIYRRISRSHVILVPTGMYASHSKWIKKELDGARQYNKPILGVNPWGQQRQSLVVGKVATKLVKWNKKSVMAGIWEMYSDNS